jgi:hypothetical protein
LSSQLTVSQLDRALAGGYAHDMKKKAAIKFYGSVANLAAALKCSTSAIYQWGDDVPRTSALELEKMTDGKLKAPAHR